MNWLQLLPLASGGGGEKPLGEQVMETIKHHIPDSYQRVDEAGKLVNEGFVIPLFKFAGMDFAITKHVIILWILVALLIVGVLAAAKSIQKDKSATGGRFAMLVQVFFDFVKDEVIGPNFHGKDAKRFLPFFCTVFFFVLLANLFGLLPYYSGTITGNLAVTCALALVTFVFMNVYGMIKQGPVSYWVHLVPGGVPGALWPMMFVIEIIGLLVKPFALMVRLFANMIAGHIVTAVLLVLIVSMAGNYAVQGPVSLVTLFGITFVNMLEILICLIQAFIFAFLSAIFVSSAGHAH